ncbi:MAG: universal stress protein [Myxococcaceae bacterium]
MAILPKKILCPVDFSDPSRVAAEHAVAVAKQVGAEVLVLHAWELPLAATGLALEGMAWAGNTALAQLEPLYREELQKFMTKLKTDGVRVESRLEQGSAAATILKTAETWKADWIVMGSEGRTGVARWLLGSVAHRVVSGAHCPVLTVRAQRA